MALSAHTIAPKACYVDHNEVDSDGHWDLSQIEAALYSILRAHEHLNRPPIVVNLSLQHDPPLPLSHVRPNVVELLEEMHSRDIDIVIAAGNCIRECEKRCSPGTALISGINCHPRVITVGGVTDRCTLHGYSRTALPEAGNPICAFTHYVSELPKLDCS